MDFCFAQGLFDPRTFWSKDGEDNGLFNDVLFVLMCLGVVFVLLMGRRYLDLPRRGRDFCWSDLFLMDFPCSFSDT